MPGLLAEAAPVRARLLALEPEYTVQAALRSRPFEPAAEVEQYAQGLRQAGLPEGAYPQLREAS